MSTRQQAEEIIFCLRDAALSYVGQLPPYIRMNVASVCKKLDKRFGDHTLPETYQRNLKQAK